MSAAVATPVGSQQQAQPKSADQQGFLGIHIHGSPIPLEWLVQRHDSMRYPAKTLVTKAQNAQSNRDLNWARSREQWVGVLAAGIHVALFAYNLAFWGSEGMPPDRYWPANSRLKMGIRAGRYGNLDGNRRVYYDNLSTITSIAAPPR
mmetsp:Transcript_7095/g.12151  ORF Transcript_7095/g.12151 Transcript_7095/m.12151 type:complete len:148 (+) Transcript_7095:157-600(+)